MPFIALKKSTGERVDITKVKSPREELVKGDLICQLCGIPMIIKSGVIRRPHFAHQPKISCTTDYGYHPESDEHRAGKELIAKTIMKELVGYSTAKIEYEWRCEETKRVADVAVLFPNGWVVVHECQLSSIIVEELQKRTEDYLNAEIDVVWWLGENANTSTNRQWCINTFGECNIIDFKESSTNFKID
jgi:competence CoiA-like predicted nuclease